MRPRVVCQRARAPGCPAGRPDKPLFLVLPSHCARPLECGCGAPRADEAPRAATEAAKSLDARGAIRRRLRLSTTGATLRAG